MKATGIVRRIDDLGRVVIPKEIRRTQRIREGDPLEIFTTGEGEVIFKKYSPLQELGDFAAQYVEILYKTQGLCALVGDRDHIVAAAGPAKKDYLGRQISAPIEKLMQERAAYSHNGRIEEAIYPCEGAARSVLTLSLVLVSGDALGSVMLLGEDRRQTPTPELESVVRVTAAFLSRQMEE